MKKLFIFLNAMLLSMAAVWADVNTQVAKLVPDKAGSFLYQERLHRLLNLSI